MVNYCVCTLFKSLFCRLFLTKLFKYCKNGVVFCSFFYLFFVFPFCFLSASLVWLLFCVSPALCVAVVCLIVKMLYISCFVLQNVSSGVLCVFLKFCFVFDFKSCFPLLFLISASVFCGLCRKMLLFFVKTFVLCGCGVIFASVFGLAKR